MTCGVATMTIGLILSGCASGSQPMSSSARKTLQNDVGVIDQAAVAHRLQATIAGLARLQSDIASLEAKGALSPSAGAKILNAAAEVQAQVGLVTTTTTTTTTIATTTTPAVPPAAPAGPGGGKAHGHGPGDGGQ